MIECVHLTVIRRGGPLTHSIMVAQGQTLAQFQVQLAEQQTDKVGKSSPRLVCRESVKAVPPAAASQLQASPLATAVCPVERIESRKSNISVTCQTVIAQLGEEWWWPSGRRDKRRRPHSSKFRTLGAGQGWRWISSPEWQWLTHFAAVRSKRPHSKLQEREKPVPAEVCQAVDLRHIQAAGCDCFFSSGSSYPWLQLQVLDLCVRACGQSGRRSNTVSQ